jgi:hypothetical protein
MAGRAAAHHSAAMYDDKKTVTVVGTVRKFDWSNPHVYIYLLQPNGTGQPTEWEVECSPPSILGRLGWSQSSIHIGDSVTVVGSPARDPGKRALLPNQIKLGDLVLFERKVEFAQLANTGAAPPISDASGTTVTYHFEVTDPEFLAHPVQGDIQWEYRPNLTYAPPKCDPENARRSFRTN